LTNVSTRVLDVEQIDEPDESYDVVLCREGLMFADDPAGAAAEIVRVLRPGGGPRSRSGDRARATRGSVSCSMPPALSLASRCHPRSIPGRA
jgi:ubiquinone/menaquinone biosynthesis C-methylase UbiE